MTWLVDKRDERVQKAIEMIEEVAGPIFSKDGKKKRLSSPLGEKATAEIIKEVCHSFIYDQHASLEEAASSLGIPAEKWSEIATREARSISVYLKEMTEAAAAESFAQAQIARALLASDLVASGVHREIANCLVSVVRESEDPYARIQAAKTLIRDVIGMSASQLQPGRGKDQQQPQIRSEIANVFMAAISQTAEPQGREIEVEVEDSSKGHD